MKPRGWGVMGALADAVTRTGLSANAVSVTSVGFAAAGAAATALTAGADGVGERCLWLAGGVCIQLRALCNLLDGMVAERRGTASAVGTLYNEVPDRLSDVAMFVGLGAAGGAWALGWATACAAVLVAYVRAQAAAAGAGQDYGGPMAKPLRMHLVALGCLFMALKPEDLTPDHLNIVLWVVLVGCGITAIRRLVRSAARLGEGAA